MSGASDTGGVIAIGIDSAKDRVDAVAMAGNVIVGHFTVDLSKPKPPERPTSLKQMYAEVGNWLSEIGGSAPVLYIEEPIVMRNLRTAVWLAETVGMLLALPYPAFLVPIDSWKQLTCGKGGVSKDEVRGSIVRRLPHTDQLFGKRQDLFDATGLALYGSAMERLRAQAVHPARGPLAP